MTEAQEQRRMHEYHEFLKAKRSELVDPLGTLTVGVLVAPLGGEVPLYNIANNPERQTTPVVEKVTPRLAHIAVSDAVELRHPVVSAPLDAHVLEGYGRPELVAA